MSDATDILYGATDPRNSETWYEDQAREVILPDGIIAYYNQHRQRFKIKVPSETKYQFMHLYFDGEGATLYVQGDLLHNTNGPAIIWENGNREWWFEGQLHREDGPALRQLNPYYEEWYERGQLHRLNGPAVRRDDCGVIKCEWYDHGQLHRDDGPAVENGQLEEWYEHGKRHRDNGPAVVFGDEKEYWLDGKPCTKDDLPTFVSRISERSVNSKPLS